MKIQSHENDNSSAVVGTTSVDAQNPSWQEVVQQSLSRSPYRPLQQLSLQCSATGVVTIEGRLPSFYLKQMAQTLVMRAAQVTRVHNNATVD